jgi:hypothetical protein
LKRREIMRRLQFFLSILLTAIPCTADVIYVKDGTTGSGTSWADAYGDLQDGLDDADPCDVIWVADGTYYPTSDYGLAIGDRGKHFRMKNGVKIYGGFPDTGAPDMADRDPNMYKTILSGDLLGNDDPDTPIEDIINDPCRTDNCYHVFYHPEGLALDPNAILDGFTITAGNAHGPGDHDYGGGMFNHHSSSPILTGCTFTGNSAYEGGGMYNYNKSNPTVTNCTFNGNLANTNGGGMFNIFSSPTVTNCKFTGNSAARGGGVYNYQFSSPIVVNCTFTSNSAWRGGGMCNYQVSSPIVVNCTFSGNYSTHDGGGGMCNYQVSSPIVTNCTFGGNSAKYGGGMFNLGSNPVVRNCTFSGNSADIYGGGVYNKSSSPTLTNCILWGNIAPDGNEIYNNSSFSPTTPVISNCDIAGCGASGAGWDDDLGSDGGGNIDADPLFVDPNGIDGIIGTEDDDLRLLEDSPCIDAGDNSAVDPNGTDLDGNPRIMNDVVDMGAYEFIPPIPPMEAEVHIVPRVINSNNRLKRIIAIVRLPEGIDKADVSDERFILTAQDFGDDGIEATWQRVVGGGSAARVFVFFSKDGLMDLVSGNGPVELTVTGKLESGRCISGTDTVRIIRPTRRRLRWRRR